MELDFPDPFKSTKPSIKLGFPDPFQKVAPSSAPIGDLPPDFGSAQVKPGEMDWLNKPVGEYIQSAKAHPLDAYLQALKGSAEVPVVIGSKAASPVGQVLGGLAGLVTKAGNELVPAYGGTPDENAPARNVQSIEQALSYEPRTPLGKLAGGAVDVPFDLLGRGARKAGESTLDMTGSPAAATAVDTAIQLAPFLFGGEKAGKALEPNAPPAAAFKEGLKVSATDKVPSGTDLMRSMTDSIRSKLQEAQAAVQAPPVKPATQPLPQPREAVQPAQSAANRGTGQQRTETVPMEGQPGASGAATSGDRLPDQIQSPAAVAGAADPAAPLHPWTPVDTQSAVPLAGGVAHEAGGPEVVIDKRMPASVDVPHPNGGTVAVDAHEAVGLHERTEWPLMHLDGPVDEAGIAALRERAGGADIPAPVLEKLRKGESLTYPEAHDIATKTENHHVKTKYGVEPERYQKALTDGIDAAKKEAPTDPDVRPTLDRKPYVDDNQTHLLAGLDELRKARDAGTATPEQMHELSRLQDTAAHTADVGGELLPGVLNARGRAQLERSGGMKPFRIKTDLDDFKTINDTLGHDIGDEALKAKAEAMRQAFGDGNSWREGGDEFGAHADTEAEAHAKMAQVREALKGAKLEGVDVNGNPVAERRIGVSYGVGRDKQAAEHGLHTDKAARKASGERIGQRSTDAKPSGLGEGSEGQGGSQVPPRAPEQEAAVTDASPRGAANPPGAVEHARTPEREVGAGDGQPSAGSAQRDTSVRNAATAVDRATHGLEPLEAASHKPWEESKAEAAKAIAENPDYAKNLATEILKSKRPITDAETMALGAERQRLEDAYKTNDEAILRAREMSDMQAEVRALAQKSDLEHQLDTNHRATQSGGTELARAMAARNAQMVADYSPARTLTRARVSYGDKFNPEVEKQVRDLTAKLAERDKQIEEMQSRDHQAKVEANAREQARLNKQIEAMEKKLEQRKKVCPI